MLQVLADGDVASIRPSLLSKADEPRDVSREVTSQTSTHVGASVSKPTSLPPVRFWPPAAQPGASIPQARFAPPMTSWPTYIPAAAGAPQTWRVPPGMVGPTADPIVAPDWTRWLFTTTAHPAGAAPHFAPTLRVAPMTGAPTTLPFTAPRPFGTGMSTVMPKEAAARPGVALPVPTATAMTTVMPTEVVAKPGGALPNPLTPRMTTVMPGVVLPTSASLPTTTGAPVHTMITTTPLAPAASRAFATAAAPAADEKEEHRISKRTLYVILAVTMLLAFLLTLQRMRKIFMRQADSQDDRRTDAVRPVPFGIRRRTTRMSSSLPAPAPGDSSRSSAEPKAPGLGPIRAESVIVPGSEPHDADHAAGNSAKGPSPGQGSGGMA